MFKNPAVFQHFIDAMSKNPCVFQHFIDVYADAHVYPLAHAHMHAHAHARVYSRSWIEDARFLFSDFNTSIECGINVPTRSYVGSNLPFSLLFVDFVSKYQAWYRCLNCFDVQN